MAVDRMAEHRLIQDLNRCKETPEVQLMLRLLEHRLQQIKDLLVECPSSEFVLLQGKGLAYSRLIHDITCAKPSIKPKDE